MSPQGKADAIALLTILGQALYKEAEEYDRAWENYCDKTVAERKRRATDAAKLISRGCVKAALEIERTQ